MATTTVQNIIDQARVKHPAFLSAGAPDGALVLGLNQRHREIVLKFADSIEGLISTSVSMATVFVGSLVGSIGGVPSYLTTYQDGYATHKDVNGVPYVTFTEAPIAGDPFGQNGGTPGFPLPTSFLKLINVTATYGDGSAGPINIIREGDRHSIPQTRYPCAFVSGNRLVPARIPTNPGVGGFADDWSQNITGLGLSYVALPTLSALTDTVILPDVVIGALVAGVAEHLAMLAKEIDAATRSMFVQLRKEADQMLHEYSTDLVGDVQQSSVIYRQ